MNFFGPSGAHRHKATNGSDTLLGEPHRTLTFASPNTYSLTVPGTVAAVAATAGVRRGDSGPVAVAVATDRDNNRRSSLGPWRTPHAGRASSTASLPHPYPYTILASPLRPATDATGSKSHTRRRGDVAVYVLALASPWCSLHCKCGGSTMISRGIQVVWQVERNQIVFCSSYSDKRVKEAVPWNMRDSVHGL